MKKFKFNILIFNFFATLLVAPELCFANGTAFNYTNAEITKVIQDFAKFSSRTFVVDPSVRGKVSIFVAKKVEVPEAYELLSSALAVNGYAISIQENTYVVKAARNIQRDLIEVANQLPALKPERMVTYVVSLKNVSAQEVIRDVRILSSKDGEVSVGINQNILVFTDWISNLYRIDRIIKELDVPVGAAQHVIPAKTTNRNDESKKANSKSTKLPLERSDFQPSN